MRVWEDAMAFPCVSNTTAVTVMFEMGDTCVFAIRARSFGELCGASSVRCCTSNACWFVSSMRCHVGVSVNEKSVRAGSRFPVFTVASKIGNVIRGLMNVVPDRSATRTFSSSRNENVYETSRTPASKFGFSMYATTL